MTGRRPSVKWDNRFSGRAIDYPPRRDIFDWIYKKYPKFPEYTCDSGGYWLHWAWESPAMTKSTGNDYVEKCGKVAVVVYTHKDHPEWKPNYRCTDHKIAARPNLIERAI
jgi:hypothetical protein